MIVFINDITVRLLKGNEEPDPGHVNVSIDAAAGPISRASLINHVHIRNVWEKDLDIILDYLNSNVPTALLSLYLSIPEYDKVRAYFKKKFKVIKAAGGLVRKKEKFLMIYRPKKWDLPKEKRKKGNATRTPPFARWRRNAMLPLSSTAKFALPGTRTP